MTRIGIVRDQRFMEHIPDHSCPESPLRLKKIYDMLDAPDMSGRFRIIEPRMASDSEIKFNHSADYINRIAGTSGRRFSYLSGDTQASESSYEAAMLAVGGMLRAIELVAGGEVNQAFSFARPPGHHAEQNRAMGFCIFNNVALGAHFARKSLGLKRVLILDWDVHHGNGTQHSFDEDPTVLFFSIHQYPHYPGTGPLTDAGRGKGEGYTINLALPRGYGDAEYVTLFEKLLHPVALEFAPELILVSAGFDIHANDPLGGMRLTTGGFAAITRSVLGLARQCCGGKAVFSLEGGYNLNALPESVKSVLTELSGDTHANLPNLMSQADPKRIDYALTRCRHVHGHFWKSLKNK